MQQWIALSSDIIDRLRSIAEQQNVDFEFRQDNCLVESPDFDAGGYTIKCEDVGLRIWDIRIGQNAKQFKSWTNTERELSNWLDALNSAQPSDISDDK